MLYYDKTYKMSGISEAAIVPHGRTTGGHPCDPFASP